MSDLTKVAPLAYNMEKRKECAAVKRNKLLCLLLALLCLGGCTDTAAHSPDVEVSPASSDLPSRFPAFWQLYIPFLPVFSCLSEF